MCKAVEIEKKGDVLRYNPGITNLTKKNPDDWFLSKNVTVKNIHIDIIAPNSTNIYRRIFKIFIIMFFMDGTQKKWNCQGKLLHTHLLLFLYLWDKNKLVTNNKKTFEFLYLSYWMSKLPNYCNCLFYFQVSLGGGGWFEVYSTWLIHYNNPDSLSAVLLNSFKFCAPVEFIWFWLFFRCLR